MTDQTDAHEEDTEQQDGSQRTDTLALAGEVLADAYASLVSKPPAGQRLEHKIALGHALAELGHAQTARRQLAVMEFMTNTQLEDRAAAIAAAKQQAERAKGPAGIVVPSLALPGTTG